MNLLTPLSFISLFTLQAHWDATEFWIQEVETAQPEADKQGSVVVIASGLEEPLTMPLILWKVTIFPLKDCKVEPNRTGQIVFSLKTCLNDSTQIDCIVGSIIARNLVNAHFLRNC